MKVLDLFSGIGGFSLGLERAGMTTVAFCEIEKFPQRVLKKHWPQVPIYEDIRQLTAERLKQDGIGPIDVVCGGFPCQPFSNAGKRKGQADDRDLWPEMFRVIQETRPAWVIGENVAGFVNMELERSFSDLEGEDYEVEALLIPACGVDAPHRRERVWIVAHSKHGRLPQRRRAAHVGEGLQGSAGIRGDDPQSCQIEKGKMVADTPGERCGEAGEHFAGPEERPARSGETLADTNTTGQRERWGAKPVSQEFNPAEFSGQTSSNPVDINDDGAGHGTGENSGEQSGPAKVQRGHANWPAEPAVGRVAHGVPNRVDRLKGLGNAVVMQVVEVIGRAIMEEGE